MLPEDFIKQCQYTSENDIFPWIRLMPLVLEIWVKKWRAHNIPSTSGRLFNGRFILYNYLALEDSPISLCLESPRGMHVLCEFGDLWSRATFNFEYFGLRWIDKYNEIINSAEICSGPNFGTREEPHQAIVRSECTWLQPLHCFSF